MSDVLRQSDFIESFWIFGAIVSFIPPIFLSFLQQLKLNRVIRHFYTCNLDIYSLVGFNLIELYSVEPFFNLCSFALRRVRVKIKPFSLHIPRDLRNVYNNIFDISIGVSEGIYFFLLLPDHIISGLFLPKIDISACILIHDCILMLFFKDVLHQHCK